MEPLELGQVIANLRELEVVVEEGSGVSRRNEGLFIIKARFIRLGFVTTTTTTTTIGGGGLGSSLQGGHLLHQSLHIRPTQL